MAKGTYRWPHVQIHMKSTIQADWGRWASPPVTLGMCVWAVLFLFWRVRATGVGKFPNSPREHNQKTHSRHGEESHNWMKRELEGDQIVKGTRIVSHAKREAGARELEEPRWFQPTSTIILLNRRKYELQPQLNLKRGNFSFSTNHCHALINNISWRKGSVEEACSVTHCTPFSLYHFVPSTSI